MFSVGSHALLACPNKASYEAIQKKAYFYFAKREFDKANKEFEKIIGCEKFYNSEKNLFSYALSLYYNCKNLLQEHSCIDHYKKAVFLIQESIQRIPKSPDFYNQLSKRYLLLGLLFFEFQNCQKVKYYFQKSFIFEPKIKKNFPEVEVIQKICKE